MAHGFHQLCTSSGHVLAAPKLPVTRGGVRLTDSSPTMGTMAAPSSGLAAAQYAKSAAALTRGLLANAKDETSQVVGGGACRF